ncbi:MAG: hypothetical protein KDN05_08130 [Verrucomicrobiae bacterium]|nr:hypothetical protein [Verrucomicrobiae bacterium]
MSTNRGIFDSFPSGQPAKRVDSPFAVVNDSEKESAASSPFAPAAREESPFTVVDEPAAETPKPVKLPEPRKVESPFQMAEPVETFGFEAPAFDPNALSSPAPTAAPFSQSRPAESASPFAVDSGPSSHGASPFGTPQPPRSPQAAALETPPEAFPQVAPSQPSPSPSQVPSAFSPEPAVVKPEPEPKAEAPAQGFDTQSDSFSIRQLELRAIFGVDREMGSEEILQRSRALPGIRNIARVASGDMATIESLKTLVANLGFGGGNLKLYSGSVPIEFIREGSVLLAVQTDGGFAPGVRETLMIVSRELNRLG